MFEELERLLVSNPGEYHRQISRLQATDPEAFGAFVERVQRELGPADEDPPACEEVVEALAATLAARLGWPRVRVLAEALLRLDMLAREGAFNPCTPAHERPAMRRRSSITTLVMGQPKTRR